MFLEISPNSQESNCTRVYFLIKLQAWGEFGEISKNTFFYRTPPVTVSVVKVSKSFERGWEIYDLWVHCFYEQSRECYHRHNRKFHICLQIKINVLCGYVLFWLYLLLKCLVLRNFYSVGCRLVCVCVFISFRRKGFSWLTKTINLMPELRSAMVCWGNDPVSSTLVTTSKTIIAGTFKLATVWTSVN